MSRTKRIAVVGASTSGLLTARLLAERGFDVTVFERAAALDPAPRTLIVTDKMFDLVGDLGRRSVVNRIDQFELFANGKVGTVPLGESDLIIERAVLIEDLAAAALDAGADIRFDHNFEDLTQTSAGARLAFRTGGESFASDFSLVVAADGTTSSVARAAGWPAQTTVPLMQALVDVPEDCEASTSRVWFRPADSPYFYWLIPDSPSRGALGLIGEEGVAIRPLLDRFLAEKGFTVHGYQAAKIPCYTSWISPYRRFGGADVYLVGDAAGQVKVSTVGGIVTGFRGAHAVANIIGGASRRKELATVRLELDLHLYLRRALHNFTTEDYCDLLDLINSGVKDSLARFNRDETPALFLRLARTQPRLLFLLLRGLTGKDRFRRAAMGDAA